MTWWLSRMPSRTGAELRGSPKPRPLGLVPRQAKDTAHHRVTREIKVEIQQGFELEQFTVRGRVSLVRAGNPIGRSGEGSY